MRVIASVRRPFYPNTPTLINTPGAVCFGEPESRFKNALNPLKHTISNRLGTLLLSLIKAIRSICHFEYRKTQSLVFRVYGNRHNRILKHFPLSLKFTAGFPKYTHQSPGNSTVSACRITRPDYPLPITPLKTGASTPYPFTLLLYFGEKYRYTLFSVTIGTCNTHMAFRFAGSSRYFRDTGTTGKVLLQTVPLGGCFVLH